MTAPLEALRAILGCRPRLRGCLHPIPRPMRPAGHTVGLVAVLATAAGVAGVTLLRGPVAGLVAALVAGGLVALLLGLLPG